MSQKNILLIAPPFIPTSKDSVAGIEQMVYVLGKSLVEKGHNVCTIAREDSEVHGTLVSGGFKDIPTFADSEPDRFHHLLGYEASVVRKFIRKNPGLDLVIDRAEGVFLPEVIEERGPDVICALDMDPLYFLNPRLFQELKPAINSRKDQFISVSKHTAEEHVSLLSLDENLQKRMHVVYNGIVTDNFSFSEKSQDYLLYLGRVTRDKSPHLAIKSAKQTGHKIVVAGGCLAGSIDSQYGDNAYFNEEIKPLLDSQVEWFGPANLEQKVELMKGAKAVLFTSQQREALPLVPLESMTCGTPVIAYNHSGAREEILNGETGFLVDSYDEMVSAIRKLDTLDRKKCRTHALNNFDYKKMGEGYNQIISLM